MSITTQVVVFLCFCNTHQVAALLAPTLLWSLTHLGSLVPKSAVWRSLHFHPLLMYFPSYTLSILLLYNRTLAFKLVSVYNQMKLIFVKDFFEGWSEFVSDPVVFLYNSILQAWKFEVGFDGFEITHFYARFCQVRRDPQGGWRNYGCSWRSWHRNPNWESLPSSEDDDRSLQQGREACHLRHTGKWVCQLRSKIYFLWLIGQCGIWELQCPGIFIYMLHFQDIS